jgi:hypothetical protein
MNTHNFVAFCGAMSVVLAVFCGIPYLRSILNGKTKPHQFSWLIFVIMNAIVALSQYLKGARASVLISLVFLVFSSIILFLSFEYGTRNTSKFDKILFGLSLFTIVAWIVTKNPSVAIWLSVLIDIFATTMIILKIKAEPHSEAAYAWGVGAAAFVFSSLSLVDKRPSVLYVRPIYGFLSDIAVLLAIYFYKKVGPKNKADSHVAPIMQ